ncbi:hypothetical protein HUJ05_006127 [Dendroctonus ponderosae]|nr:hypothetical protein HUJ05_006127 [Dendroctonus ponderosae]
MLSEDYRVIKALNFARHSLYNKCELCATAGHVHLTVGSVYLELAGFNKALDSFQQAHRIALALRDTALELQVNECDEGDVSNYSLTVAVLARFTWDYPNCSAGSRMPRKVPDTPPKRTICRDLFS